MTVVKSKFEPKENQFYETEPWAVDALFRVIGHKINQDTNFWEPSAGNHKISDRIKKLYPFADVYTSDVARYDRKHDFIFDFYSEYVNSEEKLDWIITNPPYGAGNRLYKGLIMWHYCLLPNSISAIPGNTYSRSTQGFMAS